MGFDTSRPVSPVVPVVVGDQALKLPVLEEALRDRASSPTRSSSRRSSKELRLRTVFMATHTDDQIDRVLEMFEKAGGTWASSRERPATRVEVKIARPGVTSFYSVPRGGHGRDRVARTAAPASRSSTCSPRRTSPGPGGFERGGDDHLARGERGARRPEATEGAPMKLWEKRRQLPTCSSRRARTSGSRQRTARQPAGRLTRSPTPPGPRHEHDPSSCRTSPRSPSRQGRRGLPRQSGLDKDRFIRFPFELYRDDPFWVPPLVMERQDFLDPKKNPFFGTPSGAVPGPPRTASWSAASPRWRTALQRVPRHARSASSACSSALTTRGGRALFDAADGWSRGAGFAQMIGPMNFSTNYECGLLVEGFDSPPA